MLSWAEAAGLERLSGELPPSWAAWPLREAGPVPDGPPPTLQQLLDEALARPLREAARRGVLLQAQLLGRGATRTIGDPLHAGRLLRHVLDNAVRHTAAGGLVWIGFADGADGPMLIVADTGCGMTPEQALRLQRGLGGGACVQSVAGVGTRIRLALDGPSGLSAPVEPATTGRRPPGPRSLVLSIEDNPIDFALIEETLSRWPRVRVEHCEGLGGALATMAALRPAVTLLDIRLADGSGLDLLRSVRRDPATADLRVFVLSADAMPDQTSAAFAAGADGYWTKPLDLLQFIDRMDELLRCDAPMAPEGRPRGYSSPPPLRPSGPCASSRR